MSNMNQENKTKARNVHRAEQSAKVIKRHLTRGHVCCFVKYKGDLPENFVKCHGCTYTLDNSDNL